MTSAIPDDWTWNGHPVEIVRVGIFLTLIEYRHLFTNLSRSQQPGDATSRQFRVRTADLEQENNGCLNTAQLCENSS